MVQVQRDAEKLLLLAPVDGQDLVALELRHPAGKVIIQAVDTVLLPGGLGMELALPGDERAQTFAQVRVIADGLGNDIAGPGKRVVCGLYALFWVYIILSGLCRFRAVPPLGKEQLRQRRETLFPRDGGPGAALLLIGPVEVLQLRQRPRGLNGLIQLGDSFS